MKTQVLLGALALVASSLLAADAADTVINAAKKLGEAGNYSWRTTSESPESDRFRGGPTEGKIAKDGTIYLVMTRGDNTTEAVIKGEKGAVKTQEGWQSLAEAAEGEGRGRFLARMLQAYKAPAAEAADLAAKAKDLKAEGDVISGDLTEEGVKALFARFRRPGSEAPEVSGAKGSVKFWIKNGVLAKYEYNVRGSMTFNNNDFDINRTTTVEIKDVGSTKVEVPADAKSKLS